MKTAVWLYFFMFVAIFDLHAQYPILSPFALSLGAAPSFIGLIMGIYSLTHLPGNLLAGFGVDRYGSKPFIVTSLIIAGAVLLVQSLVTDPWQLLAVRSVSGFVLAFLSPACQSLLAKLSQDPLMQGKLMAGNGLVHTIASVFSPAAGAYLVAQIGFATAFTVLGWVLIATGLFAALFLRDIKPAAAGMKPNPSAAPAVPAPIPLHGKRPAYGAAAAGMSSGSQSIRSGIPWLFFGIPLAISCSQGIISFELPLMSAAKSSLLTSGLLFSMISVGALITLSMMFLQRYSPLARTIIGSLALALVFFGMAVHWPVPLYGSLLLIGMAKGVIFPAMASLLIYLTGPERYGRVFSILSVALSIGAFFGPTLAGQLRDNVSSYFIAFVVLMIALCLLSAIRTLPKQPATPQPAPPLRHHPPAG
ncbi:MFS transporter [Paenibacillus sp. y28]|uniref:MFS transporter n=1 Tax=Paenibacillus sp. y28 TaxID=3129110 RepID=UPI0030199B77